MGKEHILSKMGRSTQVNGKIMKNMEKVKSIGQMAKHIQASFSKISSKELELIHGQMADRIRDHGFKTKWMEKVDINGQKTTSTRVNSLMV